jgi:DnaJ-like protein
MEFEGDPHATLGLPRGASRAEIKAAYRRLAKAFHPDTAGQAAIPRFLAIQAAYETLIGTAPGRPARAAPTEGWRADPGRAGATRAGWRGSRRTSGSGASSGATPKSGATGGPDGGSGTGPGTGKDRGRAPGGRRAPRDRAPDKATPGSTTYDFAEQDPYDPEWSGASWYGTTSGTYWTINPREYADPRKHGPEYQARARRRAGGGPEGAAEPAERGTSAAAPEDAASSQEPAPTEPAAPREPSAVPRQRRAAEPDAEASAILPMGGGPTTRIGLALLGWPPLGFAVAALIGEASGCSRFAAACVDTFGFGTLLAQVVVIAVLFALPRLAAVSAVGTLAVLGASIPATMLLSVSGGPQEREAATAALTVVLAAAYLAGAAFAIARRSRTLPA